MEKLADEHIDILYNLQDGLENLTGVSREELKPYLHLSRLGLIEYGYLDLSDGCRILRAELSEKGKDYLASLEDQETKYSKDHTIAVLALLLSIASLLIDIAERIS